MSSGLPTRRSRTGSKSAILGRPQQLCNESKGDILRAVNPLVGSGGLPEQEDCLQTRRKSRMPPHQEHSAGVVSCCEVVRQMTGHCPSVTCQQCSPDNFRCQQQVRVQSSLRRCPRFADDKDVHRRLLIAKGGNKILRYVLV